MKLYEEYLLELNRWKKNINNLGLHDIQRIKDADIPKNHKDYIKGINKGTTQIQQKIGVPEKRTILNRKHQHTTNLSTGDQEILNPYSWKGGKSGKELDIENRREWKKTEPYVRRHEADEARYAKKIKTKYKGGVTTKSIIGNHKSLGVLKKEKELTDYAGKIYKDASKLIDYRNKSGEYEKVKDLSYKQINKMDKIQAKKNLANLRSLMIKEYGNGNKEKALRLLRRYRKLMKFLKV